MDPEWEPDTSEFEALPWSKVAIWGRAGEDAQRVEEVTQWIVDHFLKVEVGVFDY
jgi:hypothetical protein